MSSSRGDYSSSSCDGDIRMVVCSGREKRWKVIATASRKALGEDWTSAGTADEKERLSV